MFRHNIKLTFRNFKKDKSTFLINLVGLSAGIACALFIYLWVADELSFDKFHAKKDRLYQAIRHQTSAGGAIATHQTNSDLLAPALLENFPEVENVTTATYTSNNIITVGEKNYRAKGLVVGKDFLEVFSFPLLEGEKKQVLQNISDIIISEELAVKFFGSAMQAMGKDIHQLSGFYEGVYQVSGVFQKNKKNSSLEFDFLRSEALYFSKRNQQSINWNSNSLRVFCTLNEGTNAENFNKKIKDFITKKDHHATCDLVLRPFVDRYLYNQFENGEVAGGRIDYVKLFSLIALFVLFIACINFMNLSTAQAAKKAKEIGIKKTIGANRKMLISQYLSEAIVLTLFATFISIVIVLLLLPQFNFITEKELELTWSTNMILSVLSIALITGIISGSYPAFYLSKFQPVEVLKGKIKFSFGEMWTRKGLVVFQYFLSTLLIVSVLVIYQQIQFLQNKKLGYEKDQILVMSREGNMRNDLDLFFSEIKKIPGVASITSSDCSITQFCNTGWGHTWEGAPPNGEEIMFTHARINYDFEKTLGIELKEGRTYSKDFGQENEKIIFNETAIKEMQIENPIGKFVNIRGNREIIGVVKDFHFQSLYQKIEPMYFILEPQFTRNIFVKIQSGMEKSVLENIESFYQEFNDGLPFQYTFLDEDYHKLYASEERVATLSQYFAIIAILISSLGLFGLAAFTTQRRKKEISIRKVLGANSLSIVQLLSSDFAKMVLIAILLGLPTSYFLAQNWLGGFAFRIELSVWYFALAGSILLLIALTTVGMQTVKAANANPANNLKSD